MSESGFSSVSILVWGVLAGLAALGGCRVAPLRGPLRVMEANGRYFTDGTGRAVYLTGVHTWSVLKDMGTDEPPVPFDYAAYIERMAAGGQNFLRLWTWELTRHAYSDYGGELKFARPFPWPRSGDGEALDGEGKFDLNRFDPAWFDRLRRRVIEAGEAGIYVSIMLFEGHAVQFSDAPWCWDGHPFNKANNVNGIDGDPNGDGRGLETYTLEVPAVTHLQEAYVRKVVETVNDLDNVLYEVCNEAGAYSTAWQYHMIRFVKACEADMPKQHPVGMTFQMKGGRNETLFAGPADWISPGPAGGYKDDPPAADSSKVIITDTDHLWGIGGTPLWVWKSFLRGLNPIYMDDLGDETDKEAVRRALGHAMALARRLDLATMTPRGELTSTGYCLARPGAAYVVLQPETGPFTLALPEKTATWMVRWLNVTEGANSSAAALTAAGRTELTPPVDGPAVVYLQRLDN